MRKVETLVPTEEEVNKILNDPGLKWNFLDLKRLGKLDANRKKSRTLMVTVANDHEACLTVAKCYESRGHLSGKNF